MHPRAPLERNPTGNAPAMRPRGLPSRGSCLTESSIGCPRKYHGSRLKFNLGWMVKQIGDEDHAHGWKMLSHQTIPYPPQLGSPRKVRRFVDAIGRHTANMVGRTASLRKHGEYVFERLFELRDEVLATKLLLLIPTDLAGNEDNASGSD